MLSLHESEHYEHKFYSICKGAWFGKSLAGVGEEESSRDSKMTPCKIWWHVEKWERLEVDLWVTGTEVVAESMGTGSVAFFVHTLHPHLFAHFLIFIGPRGEVMKHSKRVLWYFWHSKYQQYYAKVSLNDIFRSISIKVDQVFWMLIQITEKVFAHWHRLWFHMLLLCQIDMNN